MGSTPPYQPFLLRCLHGLTGLFLIAAILTAFWTYNTYDGRWGTVPLPNFPAIEGIHGTFGLWTLLIFPVFVVYACRPGQRRLVQANSLAQLAQPGQPLWWYTLHRGANTLALFALAFALFSGKMMDETWLPQGELTHSWYYAHLVSWGVMVAAIALHLLLSVRVGGPPLLLSIVQWRYRPQDSPTRWPQQARDWWQRHWPRPWLGWWQSRSALIGLEVTLLGTILAAWLISMLKG
ncbi:cytochrome b/b6 domain-containing protein [Leptolyngbya sp. KIOST-1]|uniref:cytochrome b/b6 domain-containing protein n=1 Tax=Leptolyngbya sp. KIOST-1 TaxID=1229172 RepID=UPI00055D8B76|nr:cytochrome b/b6 domain-containing protein [Leptolyngbya sp. KIOST-1]